MRVFNHRTLFYNANIYQMTGLENEKHHDALAVEGKRILDVGSREELEAKFVFRRKIDQRGRTVLPGIIDSHSHFVFHAMAESLFVKLFSSPLGGIASIQDVTDKMKAHDLAKNPDVLIGFGFDDTKIPEYRFPTRDELDGISADKPVLIIHQSFHLMSVNTKALEAAGFLHENFVVPEGGVAYRDADGKLNGLLEEPPVIERIYESLLKKLIFKNNIFNIMASGSERCLRKGITTVNEGAAKENQLALFRLAAFFGKLKVRLIFNPAVSEKIKYEKYENRQGMYLDLRKRITLGPMKLFTDGSIQGYTAYLKEPYHVQHRSRGKSADYSGYLTVSEERYEERVKHLHEHGLQYAVHANGDRAIQLVIDTEEKCKDIVPRCIKSGGHGDRPMGNIIIHCQMASADQLVRMKELGLSPSFFPVHTYVWGRHHRDTYLGEVRASRMNPLHTAKSMDIKFTVHNDSPVIPVDPWLTLWSAVSRQDEDGKLIGGNERISVYDGLLALTAHAAEQYLLPDRGTLEAGKLADFIVIDTNPLDMDNTAIKDIHVAQVYLDGKSVYSNR